MDAYEHDRTGESASPTPGGMSPRLDRPRLDLRPVVVAAFLSATLASGLTLGLIELAVPRSATTDTTGSAAASPAGASVSDASDEILASVTEADAIAAVAAAASPSVVTITTEGASGFSPFGAPSTGVGSGIIVSTDGLILTNEHVVADSGSITVTLSDGSEVLASVLATDATNDLALLKVSTAGLTPATLGDSTTVRVGQVAIAIGSPLGEFTETVTLGIVSGLDREIDVTETGTRTVTHLSGLIQTDAAINPGNSGGPLLDAAGAVIGVVTAEAGDAEGVGFAVPIDAALPLIRQATTT